MALPTYSALKSTLRQYTPLLLCMAMALIPVAPLLLGFLIPKHDTLFAFEAFKYAYTSLFYYGEFPLWNPYVSHGIATSLNDLYANGAPQFLAMFIGKALQLTNTLTVYAFSLYLQQLLLAVPFYLVLRELGSEQRISLFFTLVLNLLTFQLIQFDFNYSIYATLPLFMLVAIHCIRYRAHLAWAAFLLLALNLYGRLTYSLVIIFYVYLMLLVGLCCIYKQEALQRWRDMRALRWNIRWQDIALLLIAGSLSGYLLYVFYVQVQEINSNLHIFAPGREENGTVSLNTFLTYGGHGSLYEKLGKLISTKQNFDFELFIGKPITAILLFGIFFGGHARLEKRQRIAFKAMGWAALTIYLFGSPILFELPEKMAEFQHLIPHLPISRLAYYLPGMNLVRHIAYYTPIAKLLLLLMAALILPTIQTREDWKKFLNILLCLIPFYSINSVAPILLVSAGLLRRMKIERYQLTIFLLIIVEMMGFTAEQYLSNKRKVTLASAAGYHLLADNTKPSYSPRLYPHDSKVLAAYVQTTNPHIARYGLEALTTLEDYCLPSARQDIFARHVADLATDLIAQLHLDMNAPNLQQLNQLAFCQNKIRIASSLDAIRPTPESLFTLKPDQSIVTQANGTSRIVVAQKDAAFSITDYSPNHISIMVNTPSNQPQFLLYGDSNHPWWQTTLDGIPAPILTVNGAYKAVELPPGAHRVTFAIRTEVIQQAWYKAIILSIAMIAALGMVFRALVMSPTNKFHKCV